MSDLSIAYRERLARLGGGGRRESESSSTLVDMTTSTRRVRSGANRSVSHEYKQARSEMRGNVVSTRSDAAALQNDLAQRYNLQNAVRPLQKVCFENKKRVYYVIICSMCHSFFLVLLTDC